MDPKFFRKYADLITEAEQTFEGNEPFSTRELSQLNRDSSGRQIHRDLVTGKHIPTGDTGPKTHPGTRYDDQFAEPNGPEAGKDTNFREGDKVYRVDQPDVPGEIIGNIIDDMAPVAYQPKDKEFYILTTHVSHLAKK